MAVTLARNKVVLHSQDVIKVGLLREIERVPSSSDLSFDSRMLATIADHTIAGFVAVLGHIMPRVMLGDTNTEFVTFSFTTDVFVVTDVTLVHTDPIPVGHGEVLNTMVMLSDLSQPAFPLQHEVPMPGREDDTIVVEVEDTVHGTILGVLVKSGSASVSMTEGYEVMDRCFFEFGVGDGVTVFVVGFIEDHIARGPERGSTDDVLEDVELLGR